MSRRLHPHDSPEGPPSRPYVLREIDPAGKGSAPEDAHHEFEPSYFDPGYSGPPPGHDLAAEMTPGDRSPTPATIIEEARGQAEAIRREARDEGFRQGLAEGGEEVARRSAELGRLIESLTARRRDLFASAERDMIDLIIAFAERVIRAELASRPESIRRTVTAAASALLAAETIRIRLHPADVPLVEPIVAELSQSAEDARVELVADEGLTPGGALVETETQLVDARAETRLNEVGRALLDELRRAQGTGAAVEPAPEAIPKRTPPEEESAGELPDLEWGEPVSVGDLDADEKDPW
ncbi:MAG: hypothetical protein KJ621_01970 [Proteobacteria bacterium]|nr:hypothetical protein [Pseudomonadota bacterium]MBU1743199.1 hypothetical protein [Pseudomonadota bacterium]